MRITAEVSADETRLTVAVEHHIAQSFSHAVDPAALRKARRTPLPWWVKRLSCVDATYGIDMPGQPTRCRSELVFELCRA